MTRRPLSALAVLALAALAAEGRPAEEHPVVTLVKSKVKDQAKPFALTVTFKVKAGKEKDLEAAFAPCLAATRKEAGCVAYELNRDADDPTVYVMFEKFKSVAALVTHLEQKHTRTLLDALGPMTDGAPTVRVFTVPD